MHAIAQGEYFRTEIKIKAKKNFSNMFHALTNTQIKTSDNITHHYKKTHKLCSIHLEYTT